MTSNVKRHVQLPRSSQKGKVPTADDLKYGEIAVNFNKEEPFIAIKGSDDSIITMDFKNAEKGPWNKGEGEHSAVLGNETLGSPTEIINTATGKYATAEGNGTTASGNNSHSEGLKTNAIGNFSHAEGISTTASGSSTHAEGIKTNAIGNFSHAEGNTTTASGSSTHAEGSNTKASGNYSHAEGNTTTASGSSSHAEGDSTTASGQFSHVEGVGSIALGDVTHVEGLHSRPMNFTDDVAAGSKELYIITTDEYPLDLDYYKNCLVKDNEQRVAIDVLNAELVPNSKFTNTTENKRIKLTLKEGVPKASTRASQATEKQKDGYFITLDYTLYNKGAIGSSGGHAEGSYTMVYEDSGHAEGKVTIAKGVASHSEGYHTIAIGRKSHAEGHSTTASGYISHAEGHGTTASGDYSHAEGNNTTASGYTSHAEGHSTTASGYISHAEGHGTTASGDYSHAEGQYTNAIGNYSHVEGISTKAVGKFSHAEGSNTNSAADYSHVEGSGSIALSVSSHVEGLHLSALQITDDITAGSSEIFILASENYSVNLDYYKNCIIVNSDRTSAIDVLSAEYAYNTKFTDNNDNKRIKLTLKNPLPKACIRATQVTGNQRDGYFVTWEYAIQNKGTIENYGSHAEGSYTMVYEDSGHAEGKLSISKGKVSHAEGYRTIAGGKYSHSEGINTVASGEISHSEGHGTTASGESSHAEGNGTKANGEYSHAEGFGSTASGAQSHSEGFGSTASGVASHAEGSMTTASGTCSHTEGSSTTASGNNSHASGLATLASNDSEFACGQYNRTNTNQIFSVGIGTADDARKNAISVTKDGTISGDVELTNGGTSMTGLKILGGIQATNGMIAPTYLNSSDERLKKDIETISENDIDKVKNVDLKSYAFKSDNSKHFGVIAQDVERAGLEELVASSTEGIKSVDYISLLILKIAELENEIKNLKEQIKK